MNELRISVSIEIGVMLDDVVSDIWSDPYSPQRPDPQCLKAAKSLGIPGSSLRFRGARSGAEIARSKLGIDHLVAVRIGRASLGAVDDADDQAPARERRRQRIERDDHVV